MSQRDIEIILSRHLAEHLTIPVFIVDPQGDLLFYNEPAEIILGYRFDETGPMPASEWSNIFQPVDHAGDPLLPEELPLVIATMKRHPANRRFWIKGMDDTLRQIDVTAFPLVGRSERLIGAVAMFWEVKE